MRDNGARWYVICGYLMMFSLGFIAAGRQLILPDAAAEFGMGNTGIGVLAAFQPAASIPTTLLLGGLTDRYSKKKMIAIFGGIAAAGTLVGCFASAAAVVMASIFLFGVGFAIVNGTMAAALLETQPKGSSKFANLTQIFYSVGAVVSPLILGRLIDGGMNWRGYFIIGAVLFAVATALFALSPYRAASGLRRAQAAESGADGRVLGALALLFMLSIGMYAAMENSQTYFIKPYFSSELGQQSLAAASISAIWVAMIPTRLLAARMRRNKGPLVCACFAVAALAALLLAVTRNATLAMIWCVLFGLAAGPAFPMIMSMAMDAFPTHTGKISNLLLCGGGICSMMANVAMGVVSDALGVGSGFFFIAAFALLGVCVAFFAARRARREGRMAQ